MDWIPVMTEKEDPENYIESLEHNLISHRIDGS